MYQPLAFIFVTEDALAKLFSTWLGECQIQSKVFNRLTSTPGFGLQKPGVILIDLKLINNQNNHIIAACQEAGIPIILLAQYSNYDIVKKNNFFEICPLPVEQDRFNLLISNAINYYKIIQENKKIRNELIHKTKDKKFLTRNSDVINIIHSIRHINHDETLIVFGEKGTGKSSLLKYIIQTTGIQKYHLIELTFQNKSETAEKLNELDQTYHFYKDQLILEITTPFPDWQDWEAQVKKTDKFKNANTFTLPPLRERPEDIQFYLSNYLEKIKHLGVKNIKGVSKKTELMLNNHHWQGNLIEFHDVIKRAVELSTSDCIEEVDVSMVLNKKSHSDVNDNIIINDIISMDEFKKKIVNYVYKKCDGNIFEAANRLKLGRATLYRLLHKYEII